MSETAQERLWLPALLRGIADDHGLDIALDFARRHGGRYLYLPARAEADHPVAQAFGVELLAWLIERHDHLARIVVPRGPQQDRAQRLAAVAEMTARQRTADEIAASLDMHVRDVHRHRARLRAREAERQGNLPL